MQTENQNRSQEPSQTGELVGVDVPRLVRHLLWRRELLVLTVCMFFLGGCSRYYGHNGYYFFWRDFDRSAISRCDFNADGLVTQQEIDEYRRRWVVDEGLKYSGGELFDSDGRKLSAEDCARRAGLMLQPNAQVVAPATLEHESKNDVMAG